MSKELEQAAEAYAQSLSKGQMTGKEYCKQDFKAGAEWMKKQTSEYLDKWMEHSVRGCEKGNHIYFQGKIALILDIQDWLKEDEK